ncbi:hypothetical protein, partial [Klebsiella pneumoniae]|uniref:hypothetical protein n=1 Tax=Klebsiella pneumoniae TaxID=573 RepID=UPI001F4B24AC
MAPGLQLILPGDFKEGAWPVSVCQCANPLTKVRCSVLQLLPRRRKKKWGVCWGDNWCKKNKKKRS